MTLTHVTIPIQFFAMKLTEVQRVILSLTCAFAETGLKMGNNDLSKLLGRGPTYISEQITALVVKGHIKIVNAQSKYRTIYFRQNPKVPLSAKPESTTILLSAKAEDTFGKSRNINERKRLKNRRTAVRGR